MKHPLLDAVFDDLYLGRPVTPGETWPRSGVTMRNGDLFSSVDVPNVYQAAITLIDAEQPDPSRAVRMLKPFCQPFDIEERTAQLAAAFANR